MISAFEGEKHVMENAKEKKKIKEKVMQTFFFLLTTKHSNSFDDIADITMNLWAIVFDRTTVMWVEIVL